MVQLASLRTGWYGEKVNLHDIDGFVLTVASGCMSGRPRLVCAKRAYISHLLEDLKRKKNKTKTGARTRVSHKGYKYVLSGF